MELDKLKEEIPYKWRVQSAKYGKATCVGYVDARDVEDLLDNVCGAGNWQCEYYEVKGTLFCKIGIRNAREEYFDEWVWKSDCGTQSNMEAEKGEASDAFKRAAVKWGVGRFLYRMGTVTMSAKEYKNGKEYPVSKTGEMFFNGDDLTEYINGIKSAKK